MSDAFSLPELFSGLPENIVFIFTERRSYTWREFLDTTASVRIRLSDYSFPSRHAAIVSDNQSWAIFLIGALWELGVIPVMINARLSPVEIKEQILFSGCGHVFRPDSIPPVNCGIAETVFPFTIGGSSAGNNQEIRYDDTAVILFTSGSGGKPKGVRITFRALADAAEMQDKFLGQDEGDRWLASLPFYHIGGFSIISRSILGRTSIIIPETHKTEDLAKSIADFKPQYISLVSSQLKELLDSGCLSGTGVKHILVGGGFTDEDLVRDALSRGLKISRVYGSTETIAFAAAINCIGLKDRPSSSGKEINKESIYILDPGGKILPAGSEGEIALRNIPLMAGYLGDEKGTAERIKNGFYLTGDIGSLDEQGFLYVHMRRSDLIVSGGENINPRDVENLIREIEGIKDVYVFGEPDAKWGQAVSALIVSSIEYSAGEIRNYLKGRTASFKIPKRIIFTDRIPRNELGKIKFNDLR